MGSDAPLVLVLLGDAADPIAAAEKLIADARVRPLEGVGWVFEAPGRDPNRVANAARQARHRARKRNASNAERNASNAPPRNASNAELDPKFQPNGGGIQSDPTPLGRVGLTDPPNVTRVTRNASNADGVTRDGVTRDARDDNPGNPWGEQVTATEAERELGRQRIRELSEQLRNERGPI